MSKDDTDINVDVKRREAFWLHVLRLNRKHPIVEVKRSLKIGKLTIRYSRRSKNNIWGRFGGGWNWKCGFSLGGSTLILHLLIADLTFTTYQPPKQ